MDFTRQSKRAAQAHSTSLASGERTCIDCHKGHRTSPSGYGWANERGSTVVMAPSAPDNILVHGIGGDAQLSGKPGSEVVQELSAYVGDRVPVAFHAPFDAAILRRHGLKLRQKWLDLAALAPVLFPGRNASESALEHWLAAFGIPAHLRHDALGDAFATAQLLLVVLAEARRQSMGTLEALFAVAGGRRWLLAR